MKVVQVFDYNYRNKELYFKKRYRKKRKSEDQAFFKLTDVVGKGKGHVDMKFVYLM